MALDGHKGPQKDRTGILKNDNIPNKCRAYMRDQNEIKSDAYLTLPDPS